MIKGLHTA